MQWMHLDIGPHGRERVMKKRHERTGGFEGEAENVLPLGRMALIQSAARMSTIPPGQSDFFNR